MDPQLQQRLIIYGGLIPGALALVLLLAAWYIHAFNQSRVDHEQHEDQEVGGGKRADGPRWLLPMLLAIGFAGADYAANETFQLWPEANNYRYTHAIGLIMLVGLIEGLVRLPMVPGFALRALGFGGAFWMLAEGYVPGVFADSSVLIGATVFASLAGAMVATGVDRNSERTPGWVDAISWLVIAGASMPIFLENRFSIGAMIPAGVIAVLVSALLVGLIFRRVRFSRGGVTALVGFMLTMLVGSIVQTGAVNMPAVLLLAISPMVLMIPMPEVSGFKQLVCRLVMLFVVLGSSAGLMQWGHGDDEHLGDDAGITDPYSDYQDMPSTE